MTAVVLEQETAVGETGVERCPECEGQLVVDASETICHDCGLVVGEDAIDHGPEWRAFTPTERDARRRVGAPRTVRRHDRGLGTDISFDSDENHALYREHKRAKFDSKHDRNRRFAMGTIQRVCGQLDLGDATIDRICYIFHDIHRELALGRTLESLIAACIFAVAREQGLPITRDDILEYIAVPDERRVFKMYHKVADASDVTPRPPLPSDYLGRLTDDVELNRTVIATAREILEAVENAGCHVGHQPMIVAAAAVYLASQHHEQLLTQSTIADIAGCSPVSIRNRRDGITESLGDDVDGVLAEGGGR
ncbi:transcription initiation factor IIB family protein [haloarchaeon 3A1-DGR]|nr:transcription initiation factor IIB family protein [haloarchaeon 3A1-DGR]